MRDARKFAGCGVILIATLGVAGQAQAQTNTPIVTGSSVTLAYSTGATPSTTTYQYGDTTFNFTNCVSCGSLELLGISNGRGGTEIEIAENPTTSAIFSNSTVGAYQSLSFTVNVATTAGTHGISSVTNILDGTDSKSSNNGQVTSLLESFSSGAAGASPTSVTSNLTTPSTKVSFALTSGSFSFTDVLTNNGPTATNPDTLSLTDVKLLLNPAPEPASIALFATGVMTLAAVRRRFHRRAKQ